jgi:hypothetical protein
MLKFTTKIDNGAFDQVNGKLGADLKIRFDRLRKTLS